VDHYSPNEEEEMKRYIITALLFSLVLAGCTSGTPQATPTPQPTSTITPSATPSPTPTLTPTPTDTPTLTPTPTSTFTPTPTPTPRGYYQSDMGFSLILPTGWEILEESAEMVIAAPSTGDILLFIAAGPSQNADEDVDSLLTTMCDGGYETQNEQELTLSDRSPANKLNFACDSPDSSIGDGQLLYAFRGTKLYIFMSVAMMEPSPNQLVQLQNLFASISLTSTQVFGLPRAETLLLMGSEPEEEDLDPAQTTGSAEGYVGLLYSGLVRLAPDMQIKPDLAESWIVSSDGLVYTFTLRANLTFQNGLPLTAEDVKYSWERAADPDTGSTTADSYLGDIVGVTEKLSGEAEEVSGVVVIDAQTLQVTLEKPVPYFLAKLTYPTSFVLSQETIEDDPDNWMFDPNASGPYELLEYREEEAVLFERNERYYDQPQIRYVAYNLDHYARNISTFEVGDVDILYLGLDERQEVQNPDHPLHAQMLTETGMCTTYILLNNTMPPMDDLNFRKALFLATDRDRLLEVIFENMVPRADTLLPPGMPGYSPFTLPVYDPEAAQEALAASAYAGDVPELTITLSGYAGDTNPYIDLLIEMWNETLGIEVRIEYLDPNGFLSAAHTNHGNMVSTGWCADYPDPSNFLDLLFATDSEFNASGYTNPEVDALLEEANIALDPAVRLELYHQVESLLLADYSAIPISNSLSYLLVSERVQGYITAPIGVKLVPYLWLEAPAP
jgi:oligopeptide transport system substrate-binding protein